MKKYFQKISAGLFFLLAIPILLSTITISLKAQQFSATVSKNNVTQGERFQITFTLENAEGSGFKAPDFRGFSVLMGPSTSQQMSFVNGQMSRSIGYSFVLQAGNPGDYTIGSASINAGGKTLQTKPITIKVLKGDQGASAQSQQDGQKSLDQQAQDILRQNIFLKVFVSKKQVYWGEYLLATYKIYYNRELAIVNNRLSELPTFQGFWSQELEMQGQNPEQEIVNGKPYSVVTLKKYVLIPQQSGQLKVDDLQWEFTVRLQVVDPNRRRHSIFDDFFDDPFFGRNNSRDFSYKAKTGTETVTVKPLPDNAPASFNGAVGNLSMEAWVDKKQATTNDPITLKAKISGNGNMKLVNELNLNFPPDFEKFEPKVADNLSIGAGGISGNKVFEYLLLPKNPGHFRIDPVEFTYFDLSKKAYITLKSNEFNVSVTKGEGEAFTGISGVSKEQIKLLGKDIRFIKTDTKLNKLSGIFYGSPIYIGLNIAPFLLFILLFLYLKKSKKLRADTSLLRNRKATKIAKKRLSIADSFLKKNDKEKYFEELSKALWGYLSDKLSIPYSDLTSDAASALLLSRGVSQEDTSAIFEMLDKCEFARFAPDNQQNEMQHTYGNAMKIIMDLEAKLR